LEIWNAGEMGLKEEKLTIGKNTIISKCCKIPETF
jgi:hypothetical protein